MLENWVLPRLSTLLIAALAVSAPATALAQAWPATVVASAPRAAPVPSHGLVLRSEEAGAPRQADLPPTDANTPRVVLKLADSADEVPDVTLRPKAEWTDDQGWRASPTRVAFKRRF